MRQLGLFGEPVRPLTLNRPSGLHAEILYLRGTTGSREGGRDQTAGVKPHLHVLAVKSKPVTVHGFLFGIGVSFRPREE